jgi:Peptidase family M23
VPWPWPITVAFLVQVVLPLWFLASLALERSASYASFYTKAAAFGLFFILIFFVGRWDLVGVWLRYGLISGFVLALIIAQLCCRDAPLWPRSNLRSLGGIAVNLVLAAVFALPLWQIMADASCGEPWIDLAFPVSNVDWYVGQGGGVPVLNHHSAMRAQAHALDIVALNGLGMRAKGLKPDDIEDYTIYGKVVVAPCSGRVLSARDDLPDLKLSERNPANPAGNHVAIACQGATVILAHLKPGSIEVAAGEEVRVQGRVGAVGNSGNTDEPHLHIHAVRGTVIGRALSHTGEPVAMRFDGRCLTRNASGSS